MDDPRAPKQPPKLMAKTIQVNSSEESEIELLRTELESGEIELRLKLNKVKEQKNFESTATYVNKSELSH